MNVLLHDVEVDGARVDVRLGGGAVVEIGRDFLPGAGEEVVDCAGGALLPGLHDHHIHLLALAAAWASVDCGSGLQALARAARSSADGWVRGVNARQSVDRHALDALVPDRPVRVQHRSGGLWMLNSTAIEQVRHVLDQSPDVERGPDGEPTGLLWRYDDRLRAALPPSPPELGPVLEELRSLGITSVTDATPDLDAEAVRILAALPMPVTMLGDPAGSAPSKLLLRDHDLPTYDDLLDRIRSCHDRGRPVAVHCVTRESLLLTLAVLDEAGKMPGDRIEHAAVVPEPVLLRGLLVVTQPAFVTTRGDDYRRDVAEHDLPHLYPYASLLSAGVRVLASSDAPFGPLDPWQVVRAARNRELGPWERVSAETALSGYLDGRRVEVGASARTCLLSVPLAAMLADPDAAAVRRTFA